MREFFNNLKLNYLNADCIIRNAQEPLLVFIDEVKFKKDEVTISLILEDDTIKLNDTFTFRDREFKIKEYTQHYIQRGKYHHTELILFNKELTTPINNNILKIYDKSITTSNCEIKDDDILLFSTYAYNLTTVNPIATMKNGANLGQGISHIVTIPYQDNIFIKQTLTVNSKIFTIESIENINELNIYLVLYIREVEEEENSI